MATVRIIFGASQSLAGRTIRLVTWSRWSHCAVMFGNTVIEATADDGVCITPISAFLKRYARTAMVDVEVGDRDGAIYAALMSQVGKPYDWSGALSLFFRRRSWNDDDAWWCSELIPWAWAEAGIPMFRATRIGRITPEHIWMLPYPQAFA